MWGGSWLHASSLRGKLVLAALAGLITTAVLTGLLIQTASASLDLVNAARERNEWVQVSTDIIAAARDYQGASYRDLREGTPKSRADVALTRHKFEKLLDRAAHLPTRDDGDRRALAQIASKGRIVRDHISRSRDLVRAVDAKWRSGGSLPALAEAGKAMAPLHDLERVLRATIGRGRGNVSAATDRADAIIRFSVTASVVGMLVAVGFSVLLLFMLEARLRPGLRNLLEGVHAFRAGHLDRRIALRGKDELTELSGAFNAMATTIQDKHDALRDIQNGLERTIADRTAELQRAYARLSSMDEQRRGFVANISHELRTALTAVRGEAEVTLRLFDRAGADPHEGLERIVEQTQDLNRLVDDLLLLALAEVRGLPLERQLCDLRDLACGVQRDFEMLAGDLGGSITASGGEPIAALVDRDKLRRALATLVENALRHCQPGVNILIETGVDEDQAFIAVCDDGPGIEPALAPKLFRRFSRGDSGAPGSGLGLSLARALIEAHEGRIMLQAAPGGGTRILLTLPLYCSEMEAA